MGSYKDNIKKIPIVGRVLKFIYNILTINRTKSLVYQQQEEIERLYREIKRVEERMEDRERVISSHFDNRTIELEDRVLKRIMELENIFETLMESAITKSDSNVKLINTLKREMELYREYLFDIERGISSIELKIERLKGGNKFESSLINRVERLEEQISKRANIKELKGLISSLKEKSPTLSEKLERATDKATGVNKKFEKLYKDFEDRFRGDRELVKKWLKIYLPVVKNHLKRGDRALDLGAGRGEWLELLRDEGFNGVGVDIGQSMAEVALKRGLKIEVKDAIEYLSSLDSKSYKLITSFHLIEHLQPFTKVLTLIEQSFRVLKSGGVMILETPNPRNILVGGCDFYLDPTHIKPIHPLALKFFVEKVGFVDVKAVVVNGDKNSFKEIEQIPFNKIDDYINIARDYAVIGVKP
jgi:O-antigen chain-terminating methyltransferase